MYVIFVFIFLILVLSKTLSFVSVKKLVKLNRKILHKVNNKTGFNSNYFTTKKEIIRLNYGTNDDDRASLPLTSVLVGFVAILGVFGTGFISTFGSAAKQQNAPKLKNTSEKESRGAMTRLTRREINKKLSNVPVFYPLDNNGGIFVKDGVGKIYTDINEAQVAAKNGNNNIGVGTLDDVYYTLIEKKTKLATYLGGTIGKSDFTAQYYLNSPDTNDVVLYRMPKLAFQKDEGLELPLFLDKEDAVSSYKQLLENKKTTSNTMTKDESIPDVEVTSLKKIVDSIFAVGGIESRAFEFYPSLKSIEYTQSYNPNTGNN